MDMPFKLNVSNEPALRLFTSVYTDILFMLGIDSTHLGTLMVCSSWNGGSVALLINGAWVDGRPRRFVRTRLAEEEVLAEACDGRGEEKAGLRRDPESEAIGVPA
jgi:hypothetical protein